MVKICIAVLIGLPGCGKSFFRQHLADWVHKKHEKSRLFVVVSVEYDKLIPLELQRDLVNKEVCETWKEVRKIVYYSVENAICHILDLKQPHDGNNVAKVSCKVITRMLLDEWSHSLCTQKKKGEDFEDNIVIVVDDNMYYQSMRYEYFQLARQYSLGFCQFYIECTLEDAVVRNAKRHDKVPEDVIRLMSDKLELPDPAKNKWECHSYSVCNKGSRSDLIDSEIIEFLNVVLSSPVQPVDDFAEDKATARTVNLTNVIHQSDVLLRKSVSDKIRSYKKSLNKQELSLAAKSLNEKKNCLLENIRNGSLIIPQLVVDSIGKQDENSVHELNIFLNSEFLKCVDGS